MCKCGRENCSGAYLLHPKELFEIPRIKQKELELNPNAKFDLIISPSSGEVFTRFYELHVFL